MSLCHNASRFDAQIVVLDCKHILTSGFVCLLHVHEAVEEVTFAALLCLVERRTGQKGQIKPKYLKQDQAAIVRLQVLNPQAVICLETFKDCPSMVLVTFPLHFILM